MRRVQRASATSQLLHVIVNGFRKVIMRDAGLLVENQVMPDASKLLHICGTAAARASSRHLRSFSRWYAFAAARFSAFVIP
jgi:hypothetical protein